MIKKTLKENKEKEKYYFSYHRLKPGVIFLLVIILGLPLALLTAFSTAFWGRIYPRVNVCGTALAGKTPKEAQNRLEKDLKNKIPARMVLLSPGKSFSLDLASLKYSPSATGQKAFEIGRKKSPFQDLQEAITTVYRGKNLVFDFQLDQNKLDSEIASVAAQLYLPAIEPEIKITKNGSQKTVALEEGKNGEEVDSRRLKKEIVQSLACPSQEAKLAIPVSTLSPKASLTSAEATEERAKTLLNKEIKLKLGEEEWTVSDEEMINFLSFSGGFDRNKIKEYTQNLAKTINTPPENAAFRFENNRVTLFRPSKDGIALKEDQFVIDFSQALVMLESGTKEEILPIPVNKTPAAISIANVNSLGIQELLGKGTSLFFGSTSERIHNVNLASLKLNGILVAPGETFSFNKNLGDVSADTGFKQAYIIKEGRTVLGDGGGVCQVSTTLFRAAINTGLPILERHAHAYRVHYYEDDLGPGFDATVFDPTADLKIKNDTSAYILIQSAIDLKAKKLTFEIYGTNDGRKVSISKARVWDKVAPLPDLYQDDPTLPAGTIKQVDWKAWGAKAAFDYGVTRNGETLTEKTFTSYYRPWQAVYLRGTGR